MGFSTAVVAELGRDAFADIVEKELRAEGVSTELLIRERKEQTGGSIVLVGKDGERVVLVHRGAAAQLGPEDLPLAALRQAHWLHLTSVAGQRQVLESVFRVVKEHAVRLSWNPGKSELALLLKVPLAELGVSCDVLFVNQEEWESVAPVQSQLKEIINTIVITNGSKGGQVLIKGQDALTFEAKQVDVTDTTGAGDSFASGYVSALLLEKTPAVAVQWGLLNASANIKIVGAKTGLLTRDEIEKMQ
jgi:sugar/nucleoside kinase (ribokinase family)